MDSDSGITFAVEGDVIAVASHEPVLRLTAYDLSGRAVASVRDLSSISIARLSPGIYILEARTVSGSRTLKFKKQ